MYQYAVFRISKSFSTRFLNSVDEIVLDAFKMAGGYCWFGGVTVHARARACKNNIVIRGKLF